jgi:hypothetical protein
MANFKGGRRTITSPCVNKSTWQSLTAAPNANCRLPCAKRKAHNEVILQLCVQKKHTTNYDFVVCQKNDTQKKKDTSKCDFTACQKKHTMKSEFAVCPIESTRRSIGHAPKSSFPVVIDLVR